MDEGTENPFSFNSFLIRKFTLFGKKVKRLRHKVRVRAVAVSS